MRYRYCVALGVLLTLSSTGYADTVTGKVVGPDGHAVVGADVFATRENDVVAARTDALGAFSFDLEAPHRRRRFYAYATAYKPGLSLATAVLKAGANVIQLSTPGSISGEVQDADGKAVADAVVQVQEVRNADGGDGRTAPDGSITGYLWVPSELRERLQVRTGADGRWTIGYLPRRGRAGVALHDERYTIAATYAPLGGVAQDALPLVARPGATVAGHVRYEDGRPAAGMRVSINYQDFVLTQDDGSYRLASRPAGTMTVRVADPSGQTVAPPLTGVKTLEGMVAAANDFILGPGALVAGTVTDKETGKPLPNSSVDIWYSNHGQRAFPSPYTDAQGHFQGRVVPGTASVTITEPPSGYLGAGGAMELTVARGETKTVTLQMTPGLQVQGVVMGEDGKPVPALRIILLSHREGGNSPRSETETDAAGRWTATGLPPGASEVMLNAEDGGEVVSPKTITLPAPGPVTINVKRLDLVPLRGRVVTNQGVPIADLRVLLQFSVKRGENGMASIVRELYTDAAGRLDVQLPAVATVSLSHGFPAYHYVSGGVVAKQDGAFTMSDLVLAPLTVHIAGTVLDAAGQHVAGAIVITTDLDPGTVARTDDQGNFVLKDLPVSATPITLRAAQAGRYGELRTAHATDKVELRLAAAPALPGTDVEGGYDLLKKLWEAGPQGVYERDPARYAALKELWPATGGRFFRYSIPTLMVADYPDRAWQLLSEDTTRPRDAALTGIITALTQRAPARAAAWALPKLDLIADPAVSFAPKLALALAIVDTQPDQARVLYRQLGDFVRAHPNDEPLAISDRKTVLAKLALLAARLAPGDVKDWRDQARKLFKPLIDHDPSVIAALIAADPASTDALLEPLEPRTSQRALADAVPLLARWNLTAATHLLDRLPPAAGGTEARFTFITALISTIVAIGPTHPDEALTLAAHAANTPFHVAALLAAAPFQPREKLVPLVRQLTALEGKAHVSLSFTSGGIGFDGSDSRLPARLAALVYDADPAYGKQLFAAEKEKLEAPEPGGGTTGGFVPRFLPVGDVAAFAYYYRVVDPAESRLMLERAFAATTQRANDGGAEPTPLARSNTRELGDIVIAMAALDTARALEMAASLKEDERPEAMRFGPSLRTEVLAKIGEYLITPEAARRTRPFKGWTGNNY